ncbi:pepsin-like aspartic protease A1 [Phytophthora cinnamomi]|uniref:pepsin-like aspartic protease A1 n=1 Tax=Phytophthora cinnamomi TaxID=4785 RepID=UPI0035599932|nr:pepsin-like aspartic protease A1 [Phytophthora cinnamomi]
MWGARAAVDGPNTIQLEMSNGVARSQAVSALQGRYRYHRSMDEELQAMQTESDEDPVDADATRNEATVETGLRAGAGSHTIQVVVGGQQRELIIDTGSGKTAFVCVGCSGCGSRRRHQPFALTDNTTYLSCDRSMTIQTSRGEPSCMACENGKCKYGQTYVEGDYWSAYKASDIMQLSSSFEARIEFGCIYEQSGVFLDQPSDGIMGFSRHPDSIFEQFYRQKVTRSRIFSQCLTEGGGMLTIGGVDLARHTEPVRYTPLRNTGYQYWTVTLQSVSVGDSSNTLQVDSTEYNADRGCVLDSGTTFLYMPESTKEPFRLAWSRAVGSFSYVPQSDTFYSMTAEQVAALPDICFWFKNDVHICLSSSRYFAKVGDAVYTGTIFFTPGPRATILGASVLEDHDIIYDVDNHRVGIAAAMCDQPMQTEVELSLDPGGEKFHAEFDYSEAPQWMLAGVTLLAVVGLINAIWVAAATEGDEVPPATPAKPAQGTTTAAANDWQGEEFSFFLMQEDDDRQPN